MRYAYNCEFYDSEGYPALLKDGVDIDRWYKDSACFNDDFVIGIPDGLVGDEIRQFIQAKTGWVLFGYELAEKNN